MSSQPVSAPPVPATGRLALVRTSASGFRPGPSIAIGGLIVLATLVVAILGHVIAPYDPLRSDFTSTNTPPWLFGGHTRHLLGTDPLGRDLLSRVIYGIRTSLYISLAAVALAVGIGGVIGLAAGYFGRVADAVLMRLTDIQLGFPFIVLAVTVLSVARPAPLTIILVLSLAAWPIYARVIRAIMLGEKSSDYVLAGRAIGASHARIIFRYVGRPLLRSIFGVATFDIANMIIFEAMLGFIAIGIQPPTVSLGNILADGKNYLFSGFWWTVTIPGIVIFIILLGVNLLADGIQQRVAQRG